MIQKRGQPLLQACICQRLLCDMRPSAPDAVVPYDSQIKKFSNTARCLRSFLFFTPLKRNLGYHSANAVLQSFEALRKLNISTTLIRETQLINHGINLCHGTRKCHEGRGPFLHIIKLPEKSLPDCINHLWSAGRRPISAGQ